MKKLVNTKTLLINSALPSLWTRQEEYFGYPHLVIHHIFFSWFYATSTLVCHYLLQRDQFAQRTSAVLCARRKWSENFSERNSPFFSSSFLYHKVTSSLSVLNKSVGDLSNFLYFCWWFGRVAFETIMKQKCSISGAKHRFSNVVT